MAKKAATQADLLIELGCEDLPARFAVPLANALVNGIYNGLVREGMHPAMPDSELSKPEHQRFPGRAYATPRRIAAYFEGVPSRQADRVVERKGPKLIAALKDGHPTPAGVGFAKSCGVEFGDLQQEDGQLVFRATKKGRPVTDVVAEIFEETLKTMDEIVPKRMRWGGGNETFVRPVKWILALFGKTTIPLQRFSLKAGNTTFGHRFHAPKAIVLKAPADYEKKLLAAKVVADFATRQARVREQIEAEAAKLYGTARITDELLAEVTALVEWPVVISGRMDERFMALPSEVIIATIETNQRYFPVFGKDGKLLPLFITVSNIQSKDVKQVITGNERVVRPRLTDALFFWEQDRKKNLLDFVPALDRVTFQKGGLVGDKARRVAKLCTYIAEKLGVDGTDAQNAAKLAKADLVTRMVFEFPELQGVMGAYYAQESGVSAEVVRAIREHYQPVQSGADIPGSKTGRILALADKLDTLTGIFAIGQKPSASKDPFGLRRAALGIVRIAVEGDLNINLSPVLGEAVRLQPKAQQGTAIAVSAFIVDRLRNWLIENKQVPVEAFDAAHLADSSTFNPLDITNRMWALLEFQKMPEATALAAAHKRIRNILKQAGEGGIEVHPDAFRESQERDLHDALMALDDKVHAAAAKGDYTGGLKLLARLQAPVDAFFDKVMVIAPEEELRRNRVALLRRLDTLCRSIADISCLPG